MSKKMKKVVPAATEKQSDAGNEQLSTVSQVSETVIDANNGKTDRAPETNVQSKPKPTTEERLDVIEKILEQVDQNFQQTGTLFTRLEPLIALSDQLKNQQAQPVQQSQQGGYGDLLKEILGSLKTSGGSTDSELAQLGKDALKSQIAMSTAITNAVVSKITGKAVVEVAEVLAT